MANENVTLKRGLAADLPVTKVPGQILVETDTGRMYVDDSATNRIAIAGTDPTKLPLSGGTVTGPIKLPTTQTTGTTDAVHYGYVTGLMSQNMNDVYEQLGNISGTVSDLNTKVEGMGEGVPTNHASTDTTYGVANATMYGHAMASTTSPKAAGTASTGLEISKFARGDHVHPAQTTITGNAGTATKLATARTITLAGDVTGSASFDGSSNITITTTSAGGGANIDDGAIS